VWDIEESVSSFGEFGNRAVVSSDGAWLACAATSGDGFGGVRFWDTVDGRLQFVFFPSGVDTNLLDLWVAFAPGRLAVVGDDGTFTIWSNCTFPNSTNEEYSTGDNSATSEELTEAIEDLADSE